MAQINYRLIDVDAFDPESAKNFPLETLLPGSLPEPGNAQEAAQVAGQIRQLLRAGDSEGALRGVLEMAPLGWVSSSSTTNAPTVFGSCLHPFGLIDSIWGSECYWCFFEMGMLNTYI